MGSFQATVKSLFSYFLIDSYTLLFLESIINRIRLQNQHNKEHQLLHTLPKSSASKLRQWTQYPNGHIFKMNMKVCKKV